MTLTAKNPLAWPDGWERTSGYRRSNKRFVTTYAKTMQRLEKEMKLLRASQVVITSNLPLRNDGLPRGDVARYRIEDPGVAVYFMLKGRQMVMARDAYDSIYDNLHSLTLAVEHLRGMERHGGGAMLERAFEGFAALPEPGNASHRRKWWQVLEFDQDVTNTAHRQWTLEQAERTYRLKARAAHPDAGGSHDQMAELNAAIAEARKALAA